MESARLPTPNRPSWIEYFMGLAFAASRRSEDPSTQHGCLITTRENRILGTGYNSFMRKVNSNRLPNTRPEKYKWMIHSEKNAVSNCIISPFMFSEGVTAYVTGRCCNSCLQHLWQNNVNRVYMAKRKATQLETEEEIQDFNLILELTGMEVIWIEPNISWLQNIQTGDSVKHD